MSFLESVQGYFNTISSKVQEAISSVRNKVEGTSEESGRGHDETPLASPSSTDSSPPPLQTGGKRKKKKMTKRKKRRQPRSTKKRNFRK